jgi:hypothetical protein
MVYCTSKVELVVDGILFAIAFAEAFWIFLPVKKTLLGILNDCFMVCRVVADRKQFFFFFFFSFYMFPFASGIGQCCMLE